MFQPQTTKKRRKPIELIQGSPGQGGFKRGYQSFTQDSRTPLDALSDMTNITLDQDNLPRPRPSLVLFGEQPLGDLLGVGTFIKIVTGTPEKWDISMQVIGGVGKVCVRKDGGTWVASVDADNSYNATARVNFCQSGSRVYISNGVDAMSYYLTSDGSVAKYVALGTPSAPSATPIGLATANHKLYYRISANNTVGESAASVADTVDVTVPRDQWIAASQYVTLTWSASGASSYNIYVGSAAGQEQYMTTVTGLTFKDEGYMGGTTGGNSVLNAFKIAPSGNSTEGPKLKYMWNKDGQLFGVGDKENPSYLWYDAGSSAVGDFSPFNGGGNVAINDGGDTIPIVVKSFRTGKGDPAVSVLSRGIAGIGKMHHVIFTTTTFDNTAIVIPNVQEANGQGGTVSANATVDANNSLWYPTGQDFKSTGTSANIQNILSTNSVSNDILPDVQRLNLSAMEKACGLVYENKIYWALPVSSDENNQIWIKDLSRKGIWIMPWIISAKFMWLSENNTTGQVDFCLYDGTNILAFSRSVATQDNGVAFNTRVAHDGLTWSDDGMTMGAIQEMRFKLLRPAGTINVKVSGLDEDGEMNSLASQPFTQTSSFTAWGEYDWYDDEYSADDSVINFTAKQVKVINLEIDETLVQAAWEITTDTIGCDYYLNTVLTTGIEVQRSYFGS